MACLIRCFEILISLWFTSVYSQEAKCGGNYLAKSDGYIATPNYPHFYKANTKCKWIIEAPSGYVVQLSFIDFDVEGNEGECLDYSVKVRNGQDENGPLLGKVLCGQSKPEAVTSVDRFMSVTFEVDDFSLELSRGFKAMYKAVSTNQNGSCLTSTCGGTIENFTSCSIQSPGFPSGFDSSLNCSWILIAPKLNQRVSIQFLDLNLNEVNGLCNRNNVTIYNGAEPTSRVLETVCGGKYNQVNRRKFVSEGSTMLIRLQTSKPSDSYSSSINGFHINFEAVDQNGNAVHDEPEKSYNTVALSNPDTMTTIPIPSTTTNKSTTSHSRASPPTAITTSTISRSTTKTITTTSAKTEILNLVKVVPETSTTSTISSDKRGKMPEQGVSFTSKSINSTPTANAYTSSTTTAVIIAIAIIVALVVVAIVLFVWYRVWKKKTGKMNRQFREADARSDVNTLLSSIDSREFDDLSKKNKQKNHLSMEQRVSEENNLKIDELHNLL